jgi:hydrogenase-4 component H
MRYPKLRELKEAIRALIKGPYTSRFPFRPHEPFERFRGRPQYHQEDCMGCAACTQVCPSGALSYKDEIKGGRAVRTLVYAADLCIFCGQCEANCPTQKGIVLTRDFDLSMTEGRKEMNHQIEKELILCPDCGEIIVPRDQYLWVADKLGPLMFTNPSVFLTYLKKLSLIPKTEDVKKPEGRPDPRRSDRFQAVCPKCRRQAVLKS